MEKLAQEVPPLESRIIDKNGAPASIPMDEEYLLKKGLIEPEGGVQPIEKSSVNIIS